MRRNVQISPIALRKAKIAYNFGLSECNRVKETMYMYEPCHVKLSTCVSTNREDSYQSLNQYSLDRAFISCL